MHLERKAAYTIHSAITICSLNYRMLSVEVKWFELTVAHIHPLSSETQHSSVARCHKILLTLHKIFYAEKCNCTQF